MNLFYIPDIEGDYYIMSPEESKHCVRVLRFVEGKTLSLVDGKGNWFNGVVDQADPKRCGVKILEKLENYEQRPFRLHLAVAPTKNIDRVEWLLEKCTEMGIDEITMLNTEHSERKVVKDERLQKVIISAMKQSLKAYLPKLNSMIDFKTFITGCKEEQKFIAHCHDGAKKHLNEVYKAGKDVIILIGPEGDFSEEEVDFCFENKYLPVTLGSRRLRTETAALYASWVIEFSKGLL